MSPDQREKRTFSRSFPTLPRPGQRKLFQLAFPATHRLARQFQLLRVHSQILYRHGAVSEPVARALAERAGACTGSDYALATTGIAGPTGGSPGNSSCCECIVRSCTGTGTFGQRARDWLTHGAVRFDELWIDIKHVSLCSIRVTNVASHKDARGAGYVRDAVRNQSASTRFCGCQRLIAFCEQFDDYFFQGFIRCREDRDSQA